MFIISCPKSCLHSVAKTLILIKLMTFSFFLFMVNYRLGFITEFGERLHLYRDKRFWIYCGLGESE